MNEAPASVDLSSPHFIAVGGAGMSGLAKICAARGSRVSGSDARESPALESLRRRGCDVHAGHRAEQVPATTSCVIVSTAVRATNPELVEAGRRGLPVIHRAQALAALMEGRRSVAVTGTHGKSSTSGMLAVALDALGLDPSYAVGADLGEPGSNARDGAGEVFIAEADESDRSFLHYHPEVAVVLNVEEDHHDVYSSLDAHIESYASLAHQIRPGGTLVVSADDPGARELVSRLAISAPGLRVVTYGETAGATVPIGKIDPEGFVSSVTVHLPDERELTFPVRVPGSHLAHNAVAALVAGTAVGVEAGEMARALGRYQGIQRRFTLKGTVAGITIVDSYAHHPTEVQADLVAARQIVGSQHQQGRVIAVFQPHLYSRTAALGAELGRVLAAADVTIIMDIYAAREDPVPGVTSALVARSTLEHGGLVRTVSDRDEIPEAIARVAAPGDLVMTMGAGDVTLLAPAIMAKLGRT